MDVQLRAVPDALEFEPGTTAWRDIDLVMPDSGHSSSPGGALARLAEGLGMPDLLGTAAWEQTMRVWYEADDRAVGVIMLWGFQDDAVAGRDVRAELRHDGGYWRIQHLTERFHCSRRVAPSGLCA